MTVDSRMTARGIVTAYIADDLDMAGKLAWELAQHPQVAANALLELADLLQAAITEAARSIEHTGQLWQAIVLADMERDDTR